LLRVFVNISSFALGKSVKMQAVVIENKAKINKPLAKPTDFTTGPKAHTPTELKPKEMPSLMPATRERKRSSTYLEIKTSVKGTAPKIKIININRQNSSHQPEQPHSASHWREHHAQWQFGHGTNPP
jgi:hypothetical protein